MKRLVNIYHLLRDSLWNQNPEQLYKHVAVDASPKERMFSFSVANNNESTNDDFEEEVWEAYKSTERSVPAQMMTKRQVLEMIPILAKWLSRQGKKDEALRDSLLNWLLYLDTLKVPVVQRSACKWLCSGTVRLPEDEEKVCRAVRVAGIHRVDPMSFARPMEIIARFGASGLRSTPIDPDTVPTLHLEKRYDNGLAVYKVDETEESRRNMRRIINTHLGKDSSPWCLLQGDKDGHLTEKSAWYWRYYSAYPKRVAFYYGKLVAFSANHVNKTVWWDRLDQPHAKISITKPVDDDPLGRIANYHISFSTGKETIYGFLYRGDSYQGWYEIYESLSSPQPIQTQYYFGGKKMVHDVSAWEDRYRDELERNSDWGKGIVYIPEGVVRIPDHAFEECSDLVEVVMPETIAEIGNSAFIHCGALRIIRFSGNLLKLGDRCFEGCVSLEDVRIPSKVISVGYSAFRGCTALRMAYIPSSVKEIGTDAFVQCSSLQIIKVPKRHYAKYVSFFGRKAVMGE